MLATLKNFAVVLGTCALLSAALSLLGGRSMASLIDLGSYVGALCLLLGAWRVLYGSNNAIESTNAIQRSQNRDAETQRRPPVHTQIIPIFLSPGALFFAGLVWLVALQTVRYTWNVAL